MNAILRSGDIPTSWNLSLVTPIYKRGPPLDTGSYRPIAVGPPLARLLAILVNVRLIWYFEDEKLFSSTQAGFREHLSTGYQHFLIQHLSDKHHHLKKALFALVVDLKSAYDLVIHWVLWELLRRAGLHGDFFTLIQAMYAHAHVAITINGHVGTHVHPLIGVRQGCPLSPTLFNVVLADLHMHILYSASEHVPYLTQPSMPVTNLDCADDALGLATSVRGLQVVADAIQDFCKERGLVINVDKTHVVVLARGRGSPKPRIVLQGQTVRVIKAVKYLGLHFKQSCGVYAHATAHAASVQGAWSTLFAKLLNL
jgi:hypothetical protein